MMVSALSARCITAAANMRYGTSTDGPLGQAGVELLNEFMRVGMILDVTHLSAQSFFEALDVYDGPVIASHHNCQALVPGERQLSDEQIRLLIERHAVIGTALDNWMLYPSWKPGENNPKLVTLESVADHIDHVCQIAGNSQHCALGTDLDGGFGTEQTPEDVNTYSDNQRLAIILERRGYSSSDVDAVFYSNWLKFFSEALPI